MLAGMGDDGNLYIIDVSRGKWDPTGLLQEAERLWLHWGSMWPTVQRIRPRAMNIEDKQAGQGLIQTLTDQNTIPVNPVPRGTDQNKYARHMNCQPQIKTGKVFIPHMHNDDGERITHTTFFNGEQCVGTDWVLPFVTECDLLTVGVLMDQETGYDDQYDTLMDAIDDNLISGTTPTAMSAMLARKRRRR